MSNQCSKSQIRRLAVQSPQALERWELECKDRLQSITAERDLLKVEVERLKSAVLDERYARDERALAAEAERDALAIELAQARRLLARQLNAKKQRRLKARALLAKGKGKGK